MAAKGGKKSTRVHPNWGKKSRDSFISMAYHGPKRIHLKSKVDLLMSSSFGCNRVGDSNFTCSGQIKVSLLEVSLGCRKLTFDSLRVPFSGWREKGKGQPKNPSLAPSLVSRILPPVGPAQREINSTTAEEEERSVLQSEHRLRKTWAGHPHHRADSWPSPFANQV